MMSRLRSLWFATATAAALFSMPLVAEANSRATFYSQEQPASPKFNQATRFQRIADGTLMSNMLGSSATTGTYGGLTIAPVSGLTVDVTPSTSGGTGAVYALEADDTSSWGGGPYNSGLALAADSTKITVQGIVSSATSAMTVTAPSTSGQSQDALIECTVAPSDTTSQSALFVYDAAGDTTPQTVNRDRVDLVSCQVKEGTAATTGSQVAPTVDSGYVAIGVVAVPQGATTVTTGMITMNTPLQMLTSLNSASYTGTLGGGGISVPFANGNCGGNRLVLTCPPFNATGNGSTDDTTAVNAAVTASKALGGLPIYSPPLKGYAISSTVDVTSNNIHFICDGSSDGFHNSGTVAPSCYFKWIGSSGGTIMLIAPVVSTSNPSIDGDGVEGFAFNSNSGLAGYGLVFEAADHGTYRNLYFDQFSSIAFQCSAILTANLAEAGDTQHNTIDQITVRNFANSGVGMSFDGTTTSDCSLNNISNLESITDNGNAINLNITDNNNFSQVDAGTIGSGTSVYFSASASGNTFFNLGTGQAPVAAAGSGPNTIFAYQSATNGDPFPTIGSGAILNVYEDRGIEHTYGYSSSVQGVGDSEIVTCRGLSTFDANASVNNCNSSGDNLNLLQEGTAYRAGFGFDSSGNLRMVIQGGGGQLNLFGSGIINGGTLNATQFDGPVVGGINATEVTACAALSTYDTNATINDCNASGDNLNLLQDGTAYRAGFGFDGSGNLRFVLSSGNFDLNGNNLISGGAITGTAITGTTASFSGLMSSSVGGDAFNFNGATSNYMVWNSNGAAAPTFTTRSAGTKLVLYPNITGSTTDYAIGTQSGSLWFDTASPTTSFTWYGGTTTAATLTGAGALTLTAGLSATTVAASGVNAATYANVDGTIAGGSVPALGIGTAGSDTTYGVLIGANLPSGIKETNITAQVGSTVQGVTGGLLLVGQPGGAFQLALSSTGGLGVAGGITAASFSGSGSGLTSGTVPNAALVTPPLTGLTAGSNVVVGTGTTPIVAVTAAPSFGGPVTLSYGAGAVSLINGASNSIAWDNAGVSAPTFTTASAGEKLLLYPQESASSADYAIGIAGSTLWMGVPTTSQQFYWYGGTTQIASLSGTGALALSSSATASSFVAAGTNTNNATAYEMPNTSAASGSGHFTILGTSASSVSSISCNVFALADYGEGYFSACVDQTGDLGVYGKVAATNFVGSGAGLFTGTIPDASLVTAPLTALTAGSNVVVGTGTTPTVAVTAAPTFSTVTVGTSSTNTATGLVIGTAAGSAGSNITASSALTAQGVGGGLLAVGLVGGTTELTLSGGGNMGVVGGATFGGGITSTTATHSGILTETVGGDALQLTNATSADILFGAGGVGAPTFTSRSVGTKIVLYPNETASSVDYAIGVSSGTTWFSTGSTTTNFVWYGGTSTAATLTGAGALSLTGGLSATTGGFSGAVTGSSFATTGTVVAGSGTATTSLAAGDIAGSRSTTTGVLWLGGSSSVGALDYGVNTVGSFTFNKPLVVQGNVTETNLTDSALTSGNCVQASTGGLLTTIPYPCAGGVSSISANAASGTAETQIIGTTVPANMMVVGTTYHVHAFGQATVTAAGTITYRIRIGSASLTGTVIQSLADTTVVGTAINFQTDAWVTVRTTGSSGTAIGRIYQVNGGTTGLTATQNAFAPVNGTAPTTATINTTQSNVVELTQQSSATTSTSTIDSATIIVEKT